MPTFYLDFLLILGLYLLRLSYILGCAVFLSTFFQLLSSQLFSMLSCPHFFLFFPAYILFLYSPPQFLLCSPNHIVSSSLLPTFFISSLLPEYFFLFSPFHTYFFSSALLPTFFLSSRHFFLCSAPNSVFFFSLSQLSSPVFLTNFPLHISLSRSFPPSFPLHFFVLQFSYPHSTAIHINFPYFLPITPLPSTQPLLTSKFVSRPIQDAMTLVSFSR